MEEVDQINEEVRLALESAELDMRNAGISGHLYSYYCLDCNYMPNAWRFSIYHNDTVVIDAEYVHDKTMTPQLTEYEAQCIEITLKTDVLIAIETWGIVTFLVKRHNDRITQLYIRMESADEHD